MITKRRLHLGLLCVCAVLIFTPNWAGLSHSEPESVSSNAPVSFPPINGLEFLQPTTIPEPDPKAIVDKGAPDDLSEDAQSTTGPIPPLSIQTGKSFASVDVGNILSAPAYLWYRGCGPTAAGMVIVNEAGGKVTTYEGEAYSPYLKSIVAANPYIHDAMIKGLQG